MTENILQDKYKIIELVGSGSQTEVYLSENLENNEKIAIKKLKLSDSKEWKTIELFQRGVKVVKNLNHSGIPKFVDSFYVDNETDREYYLIEEFIDGETLQKKLENGKFFDISEVYAFTKDILEILNYLHNLHPPIIHRDIKPSNIMIDKNNKVYLIDFGTIQKEVFKKDGGSTIVGTLGYTPPEQLMGKSVLQSDLYSVGATIIHLLTHKSPSELELKNMTIQYKNLVNIDNNFKLFIDKMIEPDVEKRFQSSIVAYNSFFNIVEKKIVIQTGIHTKFILPFIIAVITILIGLYFITITKPVTVIDKPIDRPVYIQKTSEKPIYSTEENNIFKDNNLYECVKDELSKNNLSVNYETVKTVKLLTCPKRGIVKLDGIEYLTNLESFYIYNNEITDLTPLKDLTQLQKLSIFTNKLTNIDDLKNLVNLDTLHIGFNKISDISVVANFKNLESLSINYNQIKDISPLKNLILLERIEAGNNKIENISSLKNLKKLKNLDISDNFIEDISIISNFESLEWLTINNNKISDISPIENLNYIQSLGISKNKIKSLSSLKNMKNLKNLWAGENLIEDISILAQLTNIEQISLYSNKIKDINDLSKLEYVKSLSISGNCLKNKTPLSNIKKIDGIENQYGKCE